MKIVEYAGLTGSGKSTQCTLLISELKKLGYKVWTYRDVNRIVARKGFRQLYRAIVTLNPLRWRYLKLLHDFTESYDNVSSQAKYCLISLFDISSLIALLFPNSVIVLDEGFVQTFTSIPHLHNVVVDQSLIGLIRIIDDKFDWCVINCASSIDTTVLRLRKRGTQDRFNLIKNDEDLKDALGIKRSNIEKVVDVLTNVINVSMDNSTDTVLNNYLSLVLDFVRSSEND